MCVNTCVPVCMPMFFHWRSEEDARCPALSLSANIPLRQGLSWNLDLLVLPVWPSDSEEPPGDDPNIAGVTSICETCLEVHIGSDQTQAFMRVHQMLLPTVMSP